MEENKNYSDRNTPSPDQKPVSGSNGKVSNFLKKNITAVISTFLLILVIIWFSVKIANTRKYAENEKMHLTTQYEAERDSMQIKSLEFASSVFSWSIRSEMMRNNMENLNQLVTEFVQKSDANLVQIVDPETRMVILSSDKKFEGIEYSNEINFEINQPVVKREDQKITIITPIMGFSNRIGVLIVEMK